MGNLTFSYFKTTKTIKLFIVLMAVLLAYTIQENNLRKLSEDGIALREQETIKTADDISYLSPALTYYNTGSIYVDPIQKYRSITRSPGYGFVYGTLLFTLGPEHALHGLKWVQLILFGISIYLFFGICSYFIRQPFLAFGVAAIYALLPFSHGFIYYTLTEGLTPSLTIIYFYFLLKAHRFKSQKTYILSSLILALIIVIRPFLLLYAIPLIGFILIDFRREQLKLIKTLGLTLVISWMFMGTWQIRNYVLLDKFTGLHPIYQKEVPGVFRPVHEDVWNFYKGFEDKGDRFHERLIPFWRKSLGGDTSAVLIEELLPQFAHLYPIHPLLHNCKLPSLLQRVLYNSYSFGNHQLWCYWQFVSPKRNKPFQLYNDVSQLQSS